MIPKSKSSGDILPPRPLNPLLKSADKNTLQGPAVCVAKDCPGAPQCKTCAKARCQYQVVRFFYLLGVQGGSGGKPASQLDLLACATYKIVGSTESTGENELPNYAKLLYKCQEKIGVEKFTYTGYGEGNPSNRCFRVVKNQKLGSILIFFISAK